MFNLLIAAYSYVKLVLILQSGLAS